MKKFLWIFLILIVLLGGTFLYLNKNTNTNIITDTQNTGVDLTSCISYFDGCNNCMVQSGQVTACTKMYCETPTEPKCLEYANTGIDLTNCTSYFDGCNNCMVESGVVTACTMMYCETPTAPKCNQYKN